MKLGRCLPRLKRPEPAAEGPGGVVGRWTVPVFGAGHANLPFDDALETLARALLDAPTTTLDTVLVVILHPHQVKRAEAILEGVLGTGR